MGCDIHIFAERKNPVTKRWEKVGKEFLNSWHLGEIADYISTNIGVDKQKYGFPIAIKYAKGEKPTNRLEEYVIGELLPPMVLSKDDPMDWWEAKSAGKLSYPFSDQPYDGRCYDLFGVLAGVRSSLEPMDYPRDIPDDTTDEIRDNYESWGFDAHSATYYYLYELLDSKYRKMSVEQLREEGIDPYFFKTMLDDALEIVENPRDLRFIFWFDN
jgi:hypothetical protein